MRRAAILATALCLAACGRDSNPAHDAASVDVFKKAAPEARGLVTAESNMAAEASVAEDAPAPSAPGADPTPQLPSATLLAYTYHVGLEAPASAVRPLMNRHEAACRAAGPAKCQVVGSSVNAQGEDAIGGQVEIRAEPKWLETFRAGLAGEAKKAGGRLTEETVESEDLTRSIVDTTARLNAQKTLRDRLKDLLRTRPGKLSDLLDTERELARVQGEIDSAESQLAVMRERVDMSTLTLSYATAARPLVENTFQPIGDALNGFLRTIAVGIAAIIYLIGAALPFAVVLGPIVWFLLKRRAKARAARKAE